MTCVFGCVTPRYQLRDNWPNVRVDAATRKRVEVNAHNDALRIYGVQPGEQAADDGADSTTSAASLPADDIATAIRPEEAKPDTTGQKLFNLDDTCLLGIGVPQSRLSLVMGLNSQAELKRIKPSLPEEAWEASV